MRGDDDLVDELAAAIADGAAIDWAAAESRAATTAGPVMRELRLLESVASLHRGLHQPGAAVSSGPPPHEPEGAFPRMWAHLRVLEPIGRGAFGVVYRAWDTRLDREVALKLQPDEPGTGGATSAIQEGRALARVRHPNVVTIYGAERIGTHVGLWMEFIRGRTLHQTLAEGGTFEPPTVAAIGVELARALGAVHDAGLVHGDIKTQNVMLAEDGRVVLMDFGAGRDLAQLPQAASAGTPMYLAPEVLRGEPASVSSDIYALGAVLFHLLTGVFPVQAADLPELRRAHDQGDPTDIRSLRPDIGRGLAAVVTRATSRDPGQRQGTAAELEHDLARASSRPMARTAAIAALVAMSLWAAVELGGWTLGWPSPTAALYTRAAGPSRPGGGSGGPPVIAVLPFTNLGRDAETDLIVDGFTAEVLHQLAIIDGLHVKSWESSVALRDRPLAELRDRLGVNLVLQGQVLWAGDRVRITVQLVDALRDVPMWSDRYDRAVADVFAVQDEISRAIVNRLRLKLDTGQRRYDTNPQAYELYLKARALTDRRGFEYAGAAVKLFPQVIAIDEAFAPAHAGLANAYAWLSMFPLQSMSMADALVIMRSSATRAIELDPRLAEAHAAMGWVYSRERDWGAAEASFEHAITLDPSLVSSYTGYSFSTLKPQERFSDAERVLQAALDRDPLSVDAGMEMAQVYHVTGRFNEAIAVLERLAAQDSQLPIVRRELGRALAFAGRPAEAIPLLEQGMSQHYLTHAYVRVGRRADAERLYAEHRAVANRAAVIAAALGDVDGAFEALERQITDEPHRVAQHLIQPEFALLRGHPRRAALRRALGLER